MNQSLIHYLAIIHQFDHFKVIEVILLTYVIGIDLGTSSVKAILVSDDGVVAASASRSYEIHHPKAGFSEQEPQDWYEMTIESISELVKKASVNVERIEGISFSGQMHGLVLLDDNQQVLRPAILWNDTRTKKQRDEIERNLGDSFLKITKNYPLEGFTLPKLLWVKENEPAIFEKVTTFLLPKDYLRFCMTGIVAQELSDASGTVLLDTVNKTWSSFIFDKLGIPMSIAAPIIGATDFVGYITKAVSERTGLTIKTKVFGGGADNACGAIGAGVVQMDKMLCSIGTSGVVATFESDSKTDYKGRLHFFNHAIPNSFYSMGVTLAAGDSLTYVKKLFRPTEPFSEFVSHAEDSKAGANGLLFAPYISGERTPYADAQIRGSFIGMDTRQNLGDFVRATLEGIVFSLNDAKNLYHENGRDFTHIISIGGGAKSPTWLQIQADVFGQPVSVLKNEEGPAMGAAMIAAVGLGLFSNFATCAEQYVKIDHTVEPNISDVVVYQDVYEIYKMVFNDTRNISHSLKRIRE